MQTIQLFITCLIDTLRPQVGEAVVQVLNRAGVHVEFPQGEVTPRAFHFFGREGWVFGAIKADNVDVVTFVSPVVK